MRNFNALKTNGQYIECDYMVESQEEENGETLLAIGAEADYEIEVYPPGDSNSEDYTCEIWIPVIKRLGFKTTD